jgi:hypothetical protein
MTERLLREADKRPVFANYPIDHPNIELFGPDELMHLPPGLIGLDEAHVYLPARGAMRLPMSWLAMLSQTRKNGWDLMWSTQHENRVDRVLRDVTNWLWLCSIRKMPWDDRSRPPRAFVARCYDPDNFRKPAGYQYPVVRRYKRSVSEAYDTFGKIQEARHLMGNDAYRKETTQKSAQDPEQQKVRRF